MTVGLVLAAAALLSRSTIHSVGGVFLTLGCAAVLLRTRLHPLGLLAGGAALGVAGLV